ncbi:pyridoxamine 5'-phosphate oxidase [uncultured Draconibacterium sp.]|uniref:pyridoxamine 5'-phosphate oxidase n=1 Tax=uncultured Draconibacterium sp. TaxID=1573823 RepID=UPI003217D5EA
MQLDHIRRDYKKAELDESTIDKNPFKQFKTWINEAIALNIADVTAMSLISIGRDGFPQSRIVLLKDFSENGFTFFTNYNSDKGQAIDFNPKVGLHFFWPDLERQIRITGTATKTAEEVSKSYFHSRPHKSQIAAVLSNQSSVIPSRDSLDNNFNKLIAELKGNDPEYPKNWGGYLVKPIKFEFWQGRESRLHDRIVFENSENYWQIKRLAP